MNFLYNVLLILATLIGSPLIIISLAKPKRRATFFHRLGLTISSLAKERMSGTLQNNAAKPIWIHALSVGEVLSAQPIVEALALRLPHMPLVFSASTMTGIDMANRLFSTKTSLVFHFPYDLLFSVRKVVNTINPSVLIIVETDIWPNILHQLNSRGAPIMLANARLSQRSFRGYRLLGRFARQVLTCINICGVQSDQDAERFAGLGMEKERIVVTGNVKFDQAEIDTTLSNGRCLRSILGFNADAPIIVAGSTHGGEEDILLDALNKLKPHSRDLKMILVPRDPGRARSVLRRCLDRKLGAGLLSGLLQSCRDAEKEVLIVNTIGILRDLYALADIAFIGGSLVPVGGHNPLEAAAYAKPIVFGPHMNDFEAVVEKLCSFRAALSVDSPQRLTNTFADLLADEDLRQAMGQRARQMLLSNKGATDRTIHLITTLVS